MKISIWRWFFTFFSPEKKSKKFLSALRAALLPFRSQIMNLTLSAPSFQHGASRARPILNYLLECFFIAAHILLQLVFLFWVEMHTFGFQVLDFCSRCRIFQCIFFARVQVCIFLSKLGKRFSWKYLILGFVAQMLCASAPCLVGLPAPAPTTTPTPPTINPKP